MDFQKFTIKSQEVIETSQEIARGYNNQSIEAFHLLAALVQDTKGVIRQILLKLEVNINDLMIVINKELNLLPKSQGEYKHHISSELSKMFDAATKIARDMKDEYISTEHIFLGLLEIKSKTSKLMNEYGIRKEQFINALKSIRGDNRITNNNPEDKYQVLEKYGRNLNIEAKDGKLDPVIGRDDEIRRVIQVLSRRRKNNPVLIGEPGVGKTAIVEGIAHRIISGDIPETLTSKTVIVLDLSALISGASYRGQFEERLKAVIKEVIDADGNIILFIDEIHNLIGAGATTGSLDAANILKPALARGDLRCIGATTLDEYKQYIEKDTALERRFQKVIVEEPSIEDTISILRGLKDRYEIHHGVKITDSAIIAAAELSARYISDRFLPDKAIDLIDEAASQLRIEIDSMPAEIDSINRKIGQLEIEKQALLRDIDSD